MRKKFQPLSNLKDGGRQDIVNIIEFKQKDFMKLLDIDRMRVGRTKNLTFEETIYLFIIMIFFSSVFIDFQ